MQSSIAIVFMCVQLVCLVRSVVPYDARKISSMSDSDTRLNELVPTAHMSTVPLHRTPHTPNASHYNVDYAMPAKSSPNAKQRPVSATAKPVYTADQYIDYYWQAPPVNGYKKDAEAGSNVAEETALVMSPSMQIVRRTVIVVIEQIRSMWDYVWSYFSEPGNTLRVDLRKQYSDLYLLNRLQLPRF